MGGSKKRRSRGSTERVSSSSAGIPKVRPAYGHAEKRASSEHQSAKALRDERWTRYAMLLAVAALTAILAWRTESARDFGTHVAAGRWILEHASWPRVDSFTYTLAGRPYIDMHGLFQVALALAHRAGGMIGIGLLRVALALGIFGILWVSVRQRGV